MRDRTPLGFHGTWKAWVPSNLFLSVTPSEQHQ